MALDLSSLKKGVLSLEAALQVAESEKVSLFSEAEKKVIKAGVIQNFEFAYELCWKFIQRWLGENQNQQDAASPVTRKELFRMAARTGLIKDPENWFAYSAARNVTAHTYDEKTAEMVYAQARPLLGDARYLLEQLEKSR